MLGVGLLELVSEEEHTITVLVFLLNEGAFP